MNCTSFLVSSLIFSKSLTISLILVIIIIFLCLHRQFIMLTCSCLSQLLKIIVMKLEYLYGNIFNQCIYLDDQLLTVLFDGSAKLGVTSCVLPIFSLIVKTQDVTTYFACNVVNSYFCDQSITNY